MSEMTPRMVVGIGVGIGAVVAYVAYKAGQTSKAQPKDANSASFKSQFRNNCVLNYVTDTTVKLHPVQQKLIEATMKLPRAAMLGAPEQLQFLAQLVKYIGAKKTLDIGVFTGFSALTVALQLPADGRVVACDISKEFTSVAEPFWKEAGVDTKIELRIAPAAESLEFLIDMGEEGTYDFAFIDADKVSYDTYYELCLKLLRPGGIIALDNLLRRGKVADSSVTDLDTQALRDINRKLAADQRVRYSLLTVGDGTGLAFKI